MKYDGLPPLWYKEAKSYRVIEQLPRYGIDAELLVICSICQYLRDIDSTSIGYGQHWLRSACLYVCQNIIELGVSWTAA